MANLKVNPSIGDFDFEELVDKLSEQITKDTVIVCIGTDKCIGDCLGPLVGTILKDNNFPLKVYGTIDNPIHALNIHDKLEAIYEMHEKKNVIGIDACLGAEENIEKLSIRDYGISPGKGVGKELPEVGECSLVGIVDSYKNSDFFFSRSIRLATIMQMAKRTSKILFEAYERSVLK